jgi:hypothetical protein
LYKRDSTVASALFNVRFGTFRHTQIFRIPYRTSEFHPNYIQSEVMPQKFWPCAVTSPSIKFVNSDAAANTFWMKAQNLNRSDSSTKPSTMSETTRTNLCGFCQACFQGVPETGDTKRNDHRNGLQALLRSERYCPLCRFFKSVVSQRCRPSVFQDGHGFTVYTRKIINRRQSAQPLFNVGFQVKGRCMVTMAFCSDSSK